MKSALILICCIFLFLQRGAGQLIPDLKPFKTNSQKLDALNNYCDSLLNASNMDALTAVSLFAISITSPKDYKNLSIFNCYLGNACEGTTVSDTVCIKHYIDALGYAKNAGNIMLFIDAAGPLMTLYDDLHDSAGIVKRDSMSVQLKKVADTTINEKAEADVLGWLVQYYTATGQNDTALQCSLKAVEIAKQLYVKGEETSDFVANAMYRLTQCFINMNQPEKRLQYLLEMRGYLTNNTSLLAPCYLRVAEDYLTQKQPEKAELYYDSLTQLAARLKNNSLIWNNRLELDIMFSQTYLVKYKNTDKAVLYAKRAVELGNTWGYSTWQANINYTMGYVYFMQKDYNKAVSFFIKGAAHAKPQYMLLYSIIERKISQSYAAMGNWEMAYRYADTAKSIKDSLDKISSDKNFADAEAHYQNKEKQQQIELKNVQIAADKKQRFWLTAGGALLVIVALLLLVIYRNKRNTAIVLSDKNKTLATLNNELEEANKTKARLFSIIGHDLRSPINQVYQFLKLQQLNPQLLTEEQKKQLSEKIQTATGSLLETMEDLLLWSKTQMSQFSAEPGQVFIYPLVSQAVSLLQLNSDAKNVLVENNLNENIKVYTDPYFLQTIVRNLLQNAIKASPADGKINIDYLQDDQRAILSIQNQGAIFTQKQYQELLATQATVKSLSGLGLRLVDELSQKIGAKILFVTTQDGQTRVDVELPNV